MTGRVTKVMSRYLLVHRGVSFDGGETPPLYSRPLAATLPAARKGSNAFRDRIHCFRLLRVEIGESGWA
jgi:hypothetical protein